MLTFCLQPQLRSSHGLWHQDHLVLHHSLFKNDVKKLLFNTLEIRRYHKWQRQLKKALLTFNRPEKQTDTNRIFKYSIFSRISC